MNEEGKTKKKRLGALDVCILLAVLLCVIGVVARVIFREESPLSKPAVMQKYTVYFTVKDIRQSSVSCFHDGDAFYIEESGVFFGNLKGVPTTTPARRVYVNSKGENVEVYNMTDDDRVARIDAEGAFSVSGVTDENGSVLLGGNVYIAPNQNIEIRSKEILVNICILSIEPE